MENLITGKAVDHPLNPLTSDEIKSAVAIAREEKDLNPFCSYEVSWQKWNSHRF